MMTAMNEPVDLQSMDEAQMRQMLPGGHPKCPTYGHPNCSTLATVI